MISANILERLYMPPVRAPLTVILLEINIPEIMFTSLGTLFREVQHVPPTDWKNLNLAISWTRFPFRVEGSEICGVGIYRFKCFSHDIYIVYKIHTLHAGNNY